MTEIALVLFGGWSELRAVPVRVTSRADQLARDIHSIFPLGLVALLARDIEVFSFQGKGALAMGFFVEESRLETFLVVAGVAIGAGGAGLELPLVLVLVAICATFVRHLAMEVGIFMAFLAGSFRVLSLKR